MEVSGQLHAPAALPLEENFHWLFLYLQGTGEMFQYLQVSGLSKFRFRLRSACVCVCGGGLY